MERLIAVKETPVYDIWPNENGITDLPEDWDTLAVAAIADIIPVWAASRHKIENSDQFQTFNERLAREWAIETGVIEDIFTIDRGTTVTLIEQGLSSALIEHGSTNKPPDYVISILRDHVDALETVTFERFESVCSMLAPIEAHVTVSTDETSHYYRAQIIDAARGFGYFANTTVYRSWVGLLVAGDSAAQLLLTFHGRGSEFAGVMVCTPVFELIYASNQDGVPNDRTQIQVTDRPFEFYFTESIEEVQSRFLTWLDETVALALSQLQRNL